MRKIFVVVLFSLLLIVLNANVFACRCTEYKKLTETFRKTPVIFVGTVDSAGYSDVTVDKDYSFLLDYRTTFSIDEAFVGGKKGKIDIYTSSQRSACGMRFQEGEQFLVFAGEIKKKETFYVTGMCSRTRLSEDKEDEIAVLRSMAKGKLEPRIYGRLEEIVRGIFLGDRKENVPMANIKIFARNGSSVYRSTTDKDGRFRFVNIKPGNYSLDVKLPNTHRLGDDSWGFAEKQKVKLEFNVTETDIPDLITIRSRIDGRIKGRVFDFQGNPVNKGLRVTLVTKDTVNDPKNKVEYIGTDTDKKGFYEFEGIPEGEYYLGINLDLDQPYKDNPYSRTFYPNVSNVEQSSSIKLGYGQKLSGFDLSLPKELAKRVINGRVFKKSGEPAVGMTVYVSNQSRHDFEDFVWLKTDENGGFSTTLLEGLEYNFSVLEKDSKGDDMYGSKRYVKKLNIDELTNSKLIFTLEN